MKVDRTKRAPWSYPKFIPDELMVMAKYYQDGAFYPGVLTSRFRDHKGWIYYNCRFYDGYFQRKTYEEDIRPYCEEEATEAKKAAAQIYENTKNEENWFYFHKQMQLELSRPLNRNQISSGMEVLVEEMKKGGPVWTLGIVKSKLKESVLVVFEENNSNSNESRTSERFVNYSSIRKSTKKNKQYFNCFDNVGSFIEKFEISSNPAHSLQSNRSTPQTALKRKASKTIELVDENKNPVSKKRRRK